ncbi:MAG: transglutaminase-like cysteine peptidase [Aliiglaciecola sp.]|uniref:transglutaminase-like cysteine peptidase n=1 Tax=Aliiglaciecola sp. TaxID=1872441 RepID=UPI0032976F2F
MRLTLLVFILLITAICLAQFDLADFTKFNQNVNRQYGPQRTLVAQKWQEILTQSISLSELEKLEAINTFFDEVLNYQTDQALWKKEDYWASAVETIGQGSGDCEDYATLKYFSLRLLGIDDAKLRLIYVKAKIGGARSRITQAHMVLGYYATPDSEPLVLDSLISEVLPSSKRKDLIPVFSFNSEGLWSGQSNQLVGNATSKLSKWRNLLAKTQEEGIQW